MTNQLSIFDDEQIIKNSNVYYVYILLNSLSNEIIYVGKGRGNRMNEHLTEFYDITNFNVSEKISFREIKSKKKHTQYRRVKLFIDIINSGGQIKSIKIYENLEEEKAFKIEMLLIFLLKRSVDYLYSTRLDNKRVSLKNYGGKLLNKSIGGCSQKGEVSYECVNLEKLIDEFTYVQSELRQNDFIEQLKNGKIGRASCRERV